MTEPCHDIAQLAHVEILTNLFDKGLAFFARIYGPTKSGLDEHSACLHTWDDYGSHMLKTDRINMLSRQPSFAMRGKLRETACNLPMLELA